MRRTTATSAAAILAGALAASPATAATLTAKLDAALRASGPHSGAQVSDLTSGKTLYARRARTKRLPASVEKLWTTSTALRRFGGSHTFRTTVLAVRRPTAGGTIRGNLYLRGGGDPNLSAKDIGRLAVDLHRLGIRRVTGHVMGDETRFDSRRGVPTSFFAPSPDVEPLSALTYTRNVYRHRYVVSPPRYAASALTVALGRMKISVANKRPGASRTPAGARVLTSTGSPPVRTLIALTNRPSDNFFAETLLKDLGASFGTAGSTASGASVVRNQAFELGLRPSIVDGSGLSRRDGTSPAQMIGLLDEMRGFPDLRGSLAHFGRKGDTLEDRLGGTYAARHCAAKTGSLHDVSALAGYCTARSGHVLAYAIFMNAIHSVDHARLLQDRMLTALLASPATGAAGTGRTTGGGAPPRP